MVQATHNFYGNAVYFVTKMYYFIIVIYTHCSLLIFCSSVNHTAPDFELTMEKPSEHDKQKYSNTEEMRGCRQINELSIETLTFEGL